MKTPIDIRLRYRPIQPTVMKLTNGVSYTERIPGKELLPYIYCYWELKTELPLAQPYLYRVVADGCIDIFFNMHHRQESSIMGLCTRFTEFALPPEFHYFGIRFLPSIFPQVYGVDAATLSNREQPLKNVSPPTAKLISEELHVARSMDKLLDDHFSMLVDKATFDPDKRFYEALGLILENRGDINIATDIDTGISDRQLRRLFRYYLGDTPKSFAKTVRFQHALSAMANNRNRDTWDLNGTVAFYDQGHFIKEFKRYYGLTPGKVR